MLAHDQPWKDNNINETIYWCSNDLWCNQTHSKEFANDRILLWSNYLFILLSIYFFLSFSESPLPYIWAWKSGTNTNGMWHIIDW